MVLFNSLRGRLWQPLIWCLLSAGGVGFAAGEDMSPSADELIQHAVDHNLEALRSKSGFTYTKASVVEELDSLGKVKERKEKVYEISCRAGKTYAKLVEVNGRPAAGADLKEQNENESNVRQVLGESRSPHDPETFLTPDLVARFAFTLLDKTNLNGRATYEIAFAPKCPQPPGRRMVDRLLNRISGTLWIDAEEFEVARADIHLRSEVDLLWGVIGCLKKLAYTVTRTRVGDGIWLNSFSSGDFEGRKLLESMRIKMRTQTSNFHPLEENG
jgi:hypothetical protein